MLHCLPPVPAGRGAMVPDQDLLLGLRLSREPGLPWGLYLPQALLGQSQSVCAVAPQDSYSIHVHQSNIFTHTFTHTLFSPAGQVPTLPSPRTAGERSPVLLDKVPAAVWDDWGACSYHSPERWGRRGTGSSSNSLTHHALMRYPPHLWSPSCAQHQRLQAP